MKWQSSFSETEEWKSVVKKTYGLKEHFVKINGQEFSLFEGNGMLSNAPFITDGGILNEIGNQIESFSEKQKTVLLKIRQKLHISSEIPYFLDDENFSFFLDLRKGEEQVWKEDIKSKTRNQVRKAEKSNFEVKIGREELLDDFYNVISEAWRDLGTPTHSKKFYRNILRELNGNNAFSSRLIVLYVNNEAASAACLIFNSEVIHHPYAATLKKYNKLSLNNGLYWEIVKFAINSGVSYFDFGRSRKSQGTFDFKKSWGAQEIPLFYYYFNVDKIENMEDSAIAKTMISVWKKMPLFFTNLVGPLVIRKILK